MGRINDKIHLCWFNLVQRERERDFPYLLSFYLFSVFLSIISAFSVSLIIFFSLLFSLFSFTSPISLSLSLSLSFSFFFVSSLSLHVSFTIFFFFRSFSHTHSLAFFLIPFSLPFYFLTFPSFFWEYTDSKAPLLFPPKLMRCFGYNTKLHLMVRLQYRRSGECAVPLNCIYPQVHSGMEC